MGEAGSGSYLLPLVRLWPHTAGAQDRRREMGLRSHLGRRGHVHLGTIFLQTPPTPLPPPSSGPLPPKVAPPPGSRAHSLPSLLFQLLLSYQERHHIPLTSQWSLNSCSLFSAWPLFSVCVWLNPGERAPDTKLGWNSSALRLVRHQLEHVSTTWPWLAARNGGD